MKSMLTAGTATVPLALDRFVDAPADLVAARQLQKRLDRKYLFSTAMLEPLLAALADDFRVVRAAGHLAATYDSLYFDTADRRMYEDHRRGEGVRYKVRIRHHLERELTFLEVKHRDGHDHTVKFRLPRRFGASAFDVDSVRFLAEHCAVPADGLIPQLWTAFRRITLVGDQVNERITLDWELELRDRQRRELLPRVVVAEIKRERDGDEAAAHIFRRLGIDEHPVSKYCLATARLAPVQVNTFSATLRAVEKLEVRT